jgi:hypothetical protein
MIKLKRKSKNSFFLGKFKKNDQKMLKVITNDIYLPNSTPIKQRL